MEEGAGGQGRKEEVEGVEEVEGADTHTTLASPNVIVGGKARFLR